MKTLREQVIECIERWRIQTPLGRLTSDQAWERLADAICELRDARISELEAEVAEYRNKEEFEKSDYQTMNEQRHKIILRNLELEAALRECKKFINAWRGPDTFELLSEIDALLEKQEGGKR